MGYSIAVDAMGGDHAPEAPVEGALTALGAFDDLTVTLLGDTAVIEKVLEGKEYNRDRLHILHTTQVVENEERSPADAIRRKKDSSMAVAMRMVREKKADGMVSAGNTGALLAGATLLVGRIPGILRPALSIALPTGERPTLVLDVGANMDCKPAYLVQFAQMSSIYYRAQYGVDSPRVGLLNVGAEGGKGNALTKEVYPMWREETALNFAGNVEARDLFAGAVEIAVCDGFAGNILLKTVEGAAGFILSLMKETISQSVKGKIGGLMLKPDLRDMKHKLDPSSVGGTPLLGVDGAVIKAHGNSKAAAMANAIGQCRRFLQSGVNEDIQKNIEIH